jgi:drug/metabolite transporter (DMT)-like permease
VLLRMDLLFVIFIGTVLGLERVGLLGWSTLPVMLAGVALLSEIREMDLGGHTAGDIMVVGGALALAVNAFIIRRILRVIPETTVAMYNMIMSGIGFLALGCFEGFDFPAPTADALNPWWWVILFGAIASAALVSYYFALRRMMIWKLRAFMLLMPVLVALGEWWLWDVRLGATQWAGAGLLIAGAGLLIYGEAREKTSVLDGPVGPLTVIRPKQ